LVLTRQVAAIAIDPANAKALLWNPAGASFDQALAAIGTPNGRVAIVGGPDVFGMFLDRYDYFHLSRVPDVRLPGGRPVFPGVPGQRPEELLVGHGLKAGPKDVLDAAKGVTLVHWHRV
jgi:dihydrofolate reductase